MTLINPQPPEHSQYRKAALQKAVSVIAEKGIQPDARFAPAHYWHEWMIKVGVHMDTSSYHWFWRDVINGLMLYGVSHNQNTIQTENIIKSTILTREPFQMVKQSQLHPVRFLKAFFSKKELHKAARILGTVLSSIAIRADIEKLEYPAWYPYLWLTWSWLDAASTQKVPENSIQGISTDSIYKDGDKYTINGVQYNHLEAMALVAHLKTLIEEDIEQSTQPKLMT